MVNVRRTIKVQLLLNELEAGALEWLAASEARTESEMVRELIREAADKAGYMRYLALLKQSREDVPEAA